MKISKKILSIFILALFAIAIVGCNGTGTVETTEAPTTDTTDTEAPTTDEGTTGAVPRFVGLFANQTYYRGSQDYDIIDGVKAMDEEDGDITEDINIVGNYSLTRVGSYTVYVTVQDSDTNLINRQVTITVKDLENADFTIPDQLTSDAIEIDLWHANGDTVSKALEQYALDFQVLYPQVTVNIVPTGANYDELRQNVINAIRGGQLPNIVQNYPDHVMEYIDNQAVVPLTPYIYHDVHGYNPDVEEESFLDIVLNYRRENSQYTSDGEFYSVPFNKSTEVMIYNKTLMDVLIADGTITEVPATWQDLFAIADDMRTAAIEDDGVIDQIAANLNNSPDPDLHMSAEDIQGVKDNFVPITYDSPANAFITLTKQWGGQYTTVSGDGQGVILFDNPQTVSAMGFFYDNRDEEANPGAFTLPGRWGADYASAAFISGQTGVTFGSTGGARYNTPDVVGDDFVFEFGVAPMPYNEDMPENRTAIQQGTNMSITTAGDDQEKLASWLFLKFLSSKEVQLDFALETGYSPIRTTIYSDPTYVQFTNGENEDGDTFIDLIAEASTAADKISVAEMVIKSKAAQAAALQADYLFYDQAFVGSSSARAAVEEAFGRIILSTEGDKQSVIDDAIAAAKSASEMVIN